MTRYRFLDAMGDVVGERDLPDHESALALAVLAPEDPQDPQDPQDLADAEVQRVEYLGPEGDWRWAGALHG